MLDAGRELDALIALQVFRYTLDYEFADTMGAPCVRELRDQMDEWGLLPHYSTEMGDAWLVVEPMRTNGFYLTLRGWIRSSDSMACFRRADAEFCITSETAPLAICRAALAACGVPS